MPRTLPALFAVAVLLAVAGCSTQPQPVATHHASPSPRTSAATVLSTSWAVPDCPSAQDVSTALGGTVTRTEPSGSGTDESCFYLITIAGRATNCTIAFQTLPGATFDSFEQEVVSNDVSSQSAVTPIPALGQAALSATADHLGNVAVFVLVNDILFSVVTTAPIDSVESLARVVVDHGAASGGTALPQLGSAAGVDVNASDAWQSACRIPVATMSGLVAGSGVPTLVKTQRGASASECEYVAAGDSLPPSIAVGIARLGPQSFGWATDGSHPWSGTTPAAAYASACAAARASSGRFATECDPTIGSGLVIGPSRTDAVLFVAGPVFYDISFFNLGVSDQLTPYYRAVATNLAALAPLD